MISHETQGFSIWEVIEKYKSVKNVIEKALCTIAFCVSAYPALEVKEFQETCDLNFIVTLSEIE